MTLVFDQNVDFSQLLSDNLNALRPKRPLHSDCCVVTAAQFSFRIGTTAIINPFVGLSSNAFGFS
jgi:hypothetical protein